MKRNVIENWISIIQSEYKSRLHSPKRHAEMFKYIERPSEIYENIINLGHIKYIRIENFFLEKSDSRS